MPGFKAKKVATPGTKPSATPTKAKKTKQGRPAKAKKTKRGRPTVAKPRPVDESVDVVEAETMKPETTVDIPNDTVTAPRKSRKKAADEGGFQVPRRPGVIPPVHL